MILLGWDILGISSYILVIFYQNHSSSRSGSITLLRNRIGDILILLSIRILISNSTWELNINNKFSLITILILTIARCTKRAQFPFSAWLPIAISAPTPISALVHSSTLVTAGVFLIIRISSNNHPTTLLILILISSITAIYARISANWEQDLKKIIALSTLRQIAIIIFAISISSIILAYFHIIIHAFFKSLIFICAGTIIHESSYQDIRIIRNNSNIPSTLTSLRITNIALIGLPFTSGYFSKDIIIEKLISSKLECILTLLIISSVRITALYSLRIIYLSNKTLIKHKPNIQNHSNNFSNIPVIIIRPTAILIGIILLWIINPEQNIILPNSTKIKILLSLIIGIILGSLLSFKRITYKLIGQSSISLWFIHLISTKIILTLSPIINLYSLNDKNWQEYYNSQKSFLNIKIISSTPDKIKSILLTSLIILILTPLLLI